MHLTFACLPFYFPIVENHPYIDQIVDSRTIVPENYLISYNTTRACARYENCIAPMSGLHRSDIWAQHCGVLLQNHNMHLKLDDALIESGRQELARIFNNSKQPKVCFCPASAMRTKDLLPHQMRGVVQALQKEGYLVYTVHTSPIPELNDMNVPMFYKLNLPSWMAIINAADYVISVDTSHFHLAGGLHKPLVGIYTFADGKVYGKYYDFELVQKHRDNNDWDCGPCYNWGSCAKTKQIPKPCLTEITVDDIMSGSHRMFERWPISTS